MSSSAKARSNSRAHAGAREAPDRLLTVTAPRVRASRVVRPRGASRRAIAQDKRWRKRWPVGSGVLRRPLEPPPDRPNPTGPRRCGGPEHSAGLSIGYGNNLAPRPVEYRPRGICFAQVKIAQPARKSIIYLVDYEQNLVNLKH